jgi:two-component system chemotaxis response regulator CheB
MLAGLPADLDAAVFVVLHLPAESRNTLARILDRAGPLPAVTAVDRAPITNGVVLVGAADHHLLLGDAYVHVRRGPRENGNRPAADPLFRSAARFYGPRVIGVVLSGMLNDGTVGLSAIRRQGGIAVVQDPADALYEGMPASALENVGADHVVPARELGPLLGRLVGEDAAAPESAPDELMAKEVALLEGKEDLGAVHPGRPSSWPCPDCNGVLWEVDDGLLRFRCRVGHAWAAESLLDTQRLEVEGALWTALRSLEDRVALSRRLADRAETDGRWITAERFRSDVTDMQRSIEVLRRLVAEPAKEERDG